MRVSKAVFDQPIARVEWVDPATLHANNYNPNKVFPPELQLLKLSLMEDGWTAPIVVGSEDSEIIDGFHRWTLGSTDAEVRALTHGLVPIVRVTADRARRILATVRHNRARGQHGIVAMGKLVRELCELGVTEAEIERRLGMEDEERERLSDVRPQPERAGQESFGKGWIPDERA